MALPQTDKNPRRNAPVQLGQMLIEKGYITDEQLKSGLEAQRRDGSGRLLGEVLVEYGFVTEEQVLEVLAEAYGIPFARVSPRIADPRVIEMLPREFLEEHCILPLFHVRQRLVVAVPEPANLFLVDEIERLSKSEVLLVAGTRADILGTLRQYLPSANVFVIDEIYEDLDPDDFSVVQKQINDLANLEEIAGHSPVVKLVNYIIYAAVQDGASDIHIEPDDGSLRVRFRVDGRLFQKLTPPPAMQAAIVSRLKIMANLDIAERRIPQDGDISVMLDGRPVDLRVSTMPGKNGEKVVIRIIDSGNAVVGVEKLGFNHRMLQQWKEAIANPNGVILVTGPTGSGKSTTLYSVLAELNSDEINISTVEDPVEASIRGVNQFQVNDKQGFTFATALRSMLRQDPDIIMVGEIRDPETARIVSQAALTGHLVFSTLHTNDAPSAVTRLINLEVEAYLVGAILRAVLAQRLVRRICLHCREPYELEPATRAAVESLVGPDAEYFHGVGCSKCRNTGFSGRLGIFELLTMNDALLDQVNHGGTIHDIRKVLQAQNFVTLRMDGLMKVQQGLTTPEEVFFATAA